MNESLLLVADKFNKSFEAAVESLIVSAAAFTLVVIFRSLHLNKRENPSFIKKIKAWIDFAWFIAKSGKASFRRDK